MNENIDRRPVAATVVSGERFVQLNKVLVELLQSLSEDEWNLPTVCDGWVVKDVAAHILDGTLRRLSMHRDGHEAVRTAKRCGSPSDLASFLANLNRLWTEASDRMSPGVLVGLLEWSERQCAEFFDTLADDGEAYYPVTWAGDVGQFCWMDVARDFTERWNHHRQIADAVGRGVEELEAEEFCGAVFNSYARAIAPAFDGVQADEGTVVRVVVDESMGLMWDVVQAGGQWRLFEVAGPAGVVVHIPLSAAWLVFTKRWGIDTFKSRFPEIRIEGDEGLGSHVLSTVAMVA